MVDFTLESKAVLDGFDHDWNGTRLRELTEMAAVAVSVPKGGFAALGNKMKTAFGGGLPEAGETFVGKGDARILDMSFQELELGLRESLRSARHRNGFHDVLFLAPRRLCHATAVLRSTT